MLGPIRFLSLLTVVACSGDGCVLESDTDTGGIITPPTYACPSGMDKAKSADVTITEYSTNGFRQTLGFDIDAQGTDGEAAACISSDSKHSRILLSRFTDEPFVYFTHEAQKVEQQDLQSTDPDDPQLIIDQTGTDIPTSFVNGDWLSGVWETRALDTKGVTWQLSNATAFSSDGTQMRLETTISVTINR
jgi:hypothetical protein